jgi:hypothetical protein
MSIALIETQRYIDFIKRAAQDNFDIELINELIPMYEERAKNKYNSNIDRIKPLLPNDPPPNGLEEDNNNKEEENNQPDKDINVSNPSLESEAKTEYVENQSNQDINPWSSKKPKESHETARMFISNITQRKGGRRRQQKTRRRRNKKSHKKRR